MEPRSQQPNDGFLQSAAGVVKATYEALNRDGTLAAAFRQGAQELYTALKPFPESIQVNEPGTILNPTQGEIARARDPDAPSPSEIAHEDSPSPPDHGQDQGQEMGRGR